MKVSTTDTTIRQALLSVLLASLMVTAGCAGILSDEGSNGGTPTSTATAGGGANNTSSADGVDLRSISIPDNGSVARSGELDRGDPKSGNKYYEPVQVAAVEGQVVNITMRAENGNPGLRIVNPDGNVTQVVSNDTGNLAGFLGGKFTQSGRYTIEATSANDNATFNYTLTIERVDIEEIRDDELLDGPRSGYNETEQYLTFARDVTLIAANLSDQNKSAWSIDYVGTQFESSNVSGPDIQASASGDYAVITYKVGDSNALSHLNDFKVAFTVSYANMLEGYVDLGDTTDPRNESWVPDMIFFRGINETGELRRTHFITTEWAAQYSETKNNDRYAAQWGSTLRIGPGAIHNDPEESGATTITDEEFPQAYWDPGKGYVYPDGTTLRERYDF